MHIAEAETEQGWVLVDILSSQPLRIRYNNRIVEFLEKAIKAHNHGVRLGFV